MGLRKARAGRGPASAENGPRIDGRPIDRHVRRSVDLLRMATGTEVEPSAAAVLRDERSVIGLGLVVSQVAMHDEVGSVLDKLDPPWQQRPGQEEHERSGDDATHKRSIPVNAATAQGCGELRMARH